MSNPENNDWPHAEQALTEGSVTYVCKYEGIYDVSEPKGMKVVQEAFIQMRDKKKNRRSEGLKRAPLVDVEISIRGIKIIYQETLCIQMQAELSAISYIASDGANQRYLAFVSNKKDNSGFECTILKNENNKTKEIVKTLGQAFDLAFREKSNSVAQETDTPSANIPNNVPHLPEPGILTREELVEHVGILRHRILDLTKWISQDELRGYMKENQLFNITEVLNDKQRQERSFQAVTPAVVSREQPKITTVNNVSPPPVGPSLLDLNSTPEVTVVPPPPSRAAPAVSTPNDLFGMDIFQQPQNIQTQFQPPQNTQAQFQPPQNTQAQFQQPLNIQAQYQQTSNIQGQFQSPLYQQPSIATPFLSQPLTQPSLQPPIPQPTQQPLQPFTNQPMQNFMGQPMQQFMQVPTQPAMQQFTQQPMQSPFVSPNPLKPERSSTNPFGANLMEIRSEIKTIEFDPLKLG